MAVRWSPHPYSFTPFTTKPLQPFSPARFSATYKTPKYIDSVDPLKFSAHRSLCLSLSRSLASFLNCSYILLPFIVPIQLIDRSSGAVRAVISEGKMVGSASSDMGAFKLTYLEGNSWLWDVSGLKFLVDPVLVGNLDFGYPWLFDGARKVLKNFQLSDLPELDCLLITQSLDDHCHLKTLKPFSQMFPNLRVIATPNAKATLDPLFNNITYLEPGESFEVATGSGSKVKVLATAGPVLGPPWQRPENGYLITSPQGLLTLYHEPHCVYKKEHLPKERADIVITPVIKLRLPKFTLVSGQEDAVELAKCLNAKFVVPMNNGELDAKGILAALLKPEGTVKSFKQLLSKEIPEAKVLEPTPGVPLEISAASRLP